MIKGMIDRAWGVAHNKHKKKEAPTAAPELSEPHSQENLQLVPLGQDRNRKRYWIADGPCTLHFDSYFLGNRIYTYLPEDIRSSFLQAIPSAFINFVLVYNLSLTLQSIQIHRAFMYQQTRGK